MSEGEIGDPAEPADDPALSVVQRLHFATTVGRHVGIEMQVVEAGAAPDALQFAGIEVVGGGKLVEHALQRGVPSDLAAAIVARYIGKPDRRAGDDG
jgi:hypothetical protein